ncbi:MAG: 4Fe-4S ferredoxin, partial [Candidatus Omnitrophica bacterium]|nr:4Fe-4S ferredoxin [Candidatus Omnitrophota bacterium]
MTIERQNLQADVVCVGFGPAGAGFLHRLSLAVNGKDGGPAIESRAVPGLPLQVLCYERADDIGFGVSGVVTRARGLHQSFPDLLNEGIPGLAPVSGEKVAYLMDPHGASRRDGWIRSADKILRVTSGKSLAFELPWIPPFMRKDEGVVFSMGQWTQWIGAQIMSEGVAQIWPGTPVTEPLIKDGRVCGVRLADQGVAASGKPQDTFMPGMDVFSQLTV